MIHSRLPLIARSAVRTMLMAGASAGVLAATIPAARAQDRVFGDMIALTAGKVQLPDGSWSQWTGAKDPVVSTAADGRPVMTIEQTRQKALLDWERFSLKADEILAFQQQSADWIAVNRVHGGQASRIDGEIRAPGRVFILNDNGVLFGQDAKIDVRQLVTARGVSDVEVDGGVTTIVQKDARAILNWSDLSSQAGEVLRFRQQQSDWLVLNRSMKEGTTRIAGDVTANGHLYLIAPQGLSIAGDVTAQQVIASSLNITDQQFTSGLQTCISCSVRQAPQFSNSWAEVAPASVTNAMFVDWITSGAPVIRDPSDAARYGVVVEQGGQVSTGALGKIFLFGPHVTNNGLLSVRDEGQVVLAAGENIWINFDLSDPKRRVEAFTGTWDPFLNTQTNFYFMDQIRTIRSVEEQQFWKTLTGRDLAIGYRFTNAEWGARSSSPGPILQALLQYHNQVRGERVLAAQYNATNNGIIRATGGGNVDFRGWVLEQMGAIEMTSTASFRGAIDFEARIYDYQYQVNAGTDGVPAANNGTVTFGAGSLTQITPDLVSTDTLPLTEGAQSVGDLTVNAFRLHMQQDSLIYMPGGNMSVWLDESTNLFARNRGPIGNANNETGTRFMMDRGATIDLSGWESTVLPMGYHQVTGRLFAAQLADQPLQRDGPLYRKEIIVDRRYGTDIANWESFDNLNQGTLDQFLLNGGKFFLDVDNDFLMKPGAVIDVSGGKVTFEEGFVTTTLLRTLDGRLIDIREANPDELYMGLANEFTQYDTKWGEQATYIIPFVSSTVSRFEEGYVQGGNAGRIDILAPDAILQGTVLGDVTIGKYQLGNVPTRGAFTIGDAGADEFDYRSNRIVIAPTEWLISDGFGITDNLEDEFGDLFGEEFDEERYRTGNPVIRTEFRRDNTLLTSDDFFNRSTMGSYHIEGGLPGFAEDGSPLKASILVEAGVALDLAHGADFTLYTDDGAIRFDGSIRTEGGDLLFAAPSIEFGGAAVLDTSGSWYNEFELLEPRPLVGDARIHGGSLEIRLNGREDYDSISLILPESMKIDLSGGALARRDGTILAGRGGSLSVTDLDADELDLAGFYNATALGLGGNGALSLATNRGLVVGDALVPFPGDPEEAEADDLLIPTALFQQSGFSSISLSGDRVLIADGTTIDASTRLLRLKGPNLTDGFIPWQMADSGTPLSQLVEVASIPIGERAPALRNGMSLTFTTRQGGSGPAPGAIFVGEGARIATEAGGSIRLVSNSGAADVTVLGSLIADGGAITVSNGGTGSGRVTLGENALLRARGAAVVTDIRTSPDGGEWRDGYLLDGGSINLSASNLVIEQGAVLDVSGVSAVFDVIPQVGSRLGRVPTQFASDGGDISIRATTLDIAGAAYLAGAGGAGASGGAFSLTFDAPFGGSGGSGSMTPAQVEQYLGYLVQYFSAGYFSDANGNPITQFYGTDLGTVKDFFGYSVNIADGLVFDSREEFLDYFNAGLAGGAGDPPALIVGDESVPFGSGGGGVLLDAGLAALARDQFGYRPPVPSAGPPQIARLPVEAIVAGGFADLSLVASPGIVFAGDVDLGGRRADGSFSFDSITLAAPRIVALDGADVSVEARVLTLRSSALTGFNPALYDEAIASFIADGIDSTAVFTARSGVVTDIGTVDLRGFGAVNLFSDGDVRFRRLDEATAALQASGLLRIKADQTYAATGVSALVKAAGGIEILPQDAGQKLNGTPLEAAATLTLEAPRIVQGGIVRSPLGAIRFNAIDDGSEGAGSVRLLPGSITSVSSDGNIAPYGALNNGDTWIDPLSVGATIDDRELRILPERTVTIAGTDIDLQDGAYIDLSGGGDLQATEFTSGVGGTRNWLAGYFNSDYDWVADASGIYAILPDFEGEVAPAGLSGGARVGEKIYLSGGSGLKAGYYTLLPAAYALLPGAYRVTADHQYGGDYTDVQLGASRPLLDGSSLQAGYRLLGDTSNRDQRTDAFLVMPRETLFSRSRFNIQYATGYFGSAEFLQKALRENKEVPDAPRTPLDGGSIVLAATRTLNLNAELNTAAAEGGRGGLADIQASLIAVAGSATDRSLYDGYLILDSDQLNDLGAASLLLGGVRRQGAINLELTVGARDVVIDNAGSVLFGPELLFASTGDVTMKSGSAVETRGTLAGAPANLRVIASTARLVDTRGTTSTTDDIIVHEVLDQGTLLRVSSGGQIDLLRDPDAVAAYNAITSDPVRLAQVNERRAAFGLSPLVPGGILTIEDGARVAAEGSLSLDATVNTIIGATATIGAPQISAAASLISVGAVPAGTGGLVFAGGSLGPLAAAEDILLRSYSSIDFHGDVTLAADGALALDSRELRAIGGGLVTVSGTTLTLTNTNRGSGTALDGDGTLRFLGDNIHLLGGDKWLSGAGTAEFVAAERLIGGGDNTLHVPGALSITAGAITAESGSRQFFDATGAIRLAQNQAAQLDDFATFGATLGFTGASVTNEGRLALTGGTVNLRARGGDVVLAGGEIDVTSDQVEIFDKRIGVGAGTISLVSDRGDILIGADATVDVSGTEAGGDAGLLSLSAALGDIRLDGHLLGTAAEGNRSGSLRMLVSRIDDLSAFNAALDPGGFRQSRSFEVNAGDVALNGAVAVQEFRVVANDGSITVNGGIETVGASGGFIQLAAARDLVLSGSARLVARATSAEGSGGTVLLETVGRDGGAITIGAGSLIDVSGTGEGGRLVRLRAPQVNGDVAIDPIGGTVQGARDFIAEAFRAYDDIATIDQGVIGQVTADAAAFMTNAGAINARLGGGVTVTPGIEIRNDGDIELATDWDLSGARYGDAAGVLTLRARGDLLINANLSDGFAGAAPGAALLTGSSWALNLVGGANLDSPNSLAVLPLGLLAENAGSVVIGGTPDTIEYYLTADGSQSRLWLLDANGKFARTANSNPYLGFVELGKDAQGRYLDPVTGEPIAIDPATGDYVDTERYARRPLPWVLRQSGATNPLPNQTMTANTGLSGNGNLAEPFLTRPIGYLQWDDSTGYLVRTGTAAINVASGRDFVLQEAASVLYTAGEVAPAVPDFSPSLIGYTPTNGGDVTIAAGGAIVGSGSLQLPSNWIDFDGITNDRGFFDPGTGGRQHNQMTWWIRFDRYRAGVGALGGGNVAISAEGDISGLLVNIPTTGRVAGGREVGEPTTFHQTGGGNLSLRAGGNIRGGVYYVGDGIGEITAGGAITGTPDAVFRTIDVGGNGFTGCTTDCDIYIDRSAYTQYYDLYPIFYTSGGQLRIQSGGDLDIDAVLDPLAPTATDRLNVFLSYTDDASASLFSAGGDIRIWNNARNINIVRELGNVMTRTFYLEPVQGGNTVTAVSFANALDLALWPGTLQATAASGSIQALGGFYTAPSPTGTLELVAGQDVILGRTGNPNQQITVAQNAANNWQSYVFSITMSQALPQLIRTPWNPLIRVNTLLPSTIELAGLAPNTANQGFTRAAPPTLHVGDSDPVRIYAGSGNAVLTNPLTVPKPVQVRSGEHIYFPRFSIQHNGPSDLTLLKAGGGIYFTGSSSVAVLGEGRLEFEAGGDFYIANNEAGIRTDRIRIGGLLGVPVEVLNPELKAADISITAGLEREPNYDGFADWLFSPEGTETPDYVLYDAGGGRMLSMYLFDRLTPRGGRGVDPVYYDETLRQGFVNYVRGLQGLAPLDDEGAQEEYLAAAWTYWQGLPEGQTTPFDAFFPRGAAAGATRPEFFLPEAQEGLVNYVRRVNGLEALQTQEEQLAWLDQAWAMWNAMPIEDRTPFYRAALNMELRTTGREATDADSERFNSSFRGYDAIARLFPGAQRAPDEALAEGEARWSGNFETFASRVISQGGGSIDFVLPGGELMLANIAATDAQTGQPTATAPQGNALRAGLVTQDGGAINIFARDSVTINNSRVLTAKGGNVLIWSSYGDIAAGAGAKTSISPIAYNRVHNTYFDMDREPAGLPTGAGIGTLASVAGAPTADVDLIAPNGIVDAGDAGIRVSGNFNVFAVEILGTDNIDVSGVATGLPVPPAAPPTSLDTGEVSAQANRAVEAVTEALTAARQNAAVLAPSIIEVRVTGYGNACPADQLDCDDRTGRAPAPSAPAAESPRIQQVALQGGTAPARYRLSIRSQPLRQAVNEVSRSTGIDIIYDSNVPLEGITLGIDGEMTAEDALRRMVRRLGLEPVAIGPRSIILRPVGKPRRG